MIEKPRLVAIDCRVNHHLVVDREQVGMVTLPDHVGVACFGRFRGEPLAGVLDNAGAGGDRAGRVAPETLNRGVTDLKRK